MHTCNAIAVVFARQAMERLAFLCLVAPAKEVSPLAVVSALSRDAAEAFQAQPPPMVLSETQSMWLHKTVRVLTHLPVPAWCILREFDFCHVHLVAV